MNRIKIIMVFFLLMFSRFIYAQTGVLPVYSCENPGVKAVTSGSSSSNFLQGIIPTCTVTVYLTGTTTLAAIYKDSNNTTQDNPFKANTNGSIPPIYAATDDAYDVKLSGGIPPNIYANPVTLTGLNSGGGGSGGGLSGLTPNQIVIAATPTTATSTIPLDSFLQTAILTTPQDVGIPNVAKTSGGGFVKFQSPNISGAGLFTHSIGDPLTAVDWQNEPTAIYENMGITSTLLANSTYNLHSNLFTDFSGGTYTGNAWTVDRDDKTVMFVTRRGIAQGRSADCDFQSVGDKACEYTYGQFYGGMQFFSDEGLNGKRMTLNQQGWLSGALSAGAGTGSTNITVSALSCSGGYLCVNQLSLPNSFADGGILYDQTASVPYAPVTISSVGNSAGAIVATLTTSPLTVSTAWGNFSGGNCDNATNDNFQNYFSVVCSVTLGTSPASLGDFVAGQHAWLSGAFNEEVEVTAVTTPVSGVQSITFQSRHNWIATQSGIMMQGTPGGLVVVETAQVAAGTSGWPIAWQVIGALSANELVIGNCHNGFCNGTETQVLPSSGVTFYQGAESIGLHDGNVLSTNVATNSVAWASGDVVIEAPTSEYQMNGLVVTQGQATPDDGGTSSHLLALQDTGPAPLINDVLIQNSSSGASFSAVQIDGLYANDMTFQGPAVDNVTGGVIHVQNSGQDNYNLFLDDGSDALNVTRSTRTLSTGFSVATTGTAQFRTLALTGQADNPGASQNDFVMTAPLSGSGQSLCGVVGNAPGGAGQAGSFCWYSTLPSLSFWALDAVSNAAPIRVGATYESLSGPLVVNTGDSGNSIIAAPGGGTAFVVNNGTHTPVFSVSTSGVASSASSPVSSNNSTIPTTADVTAALAGISSGLSGLTTGQVGIAGSAATITSSKPLTGTGSIVASNSPALTGAPTVNGNDICQSTGTDCPPQAGHAIPSTTLSSTISANSCTGGSFSVSFNTGITSSSTAEFNVAQDPTTIGGWDTGALHALIENAGTQFNVYICNSSATSVTAAPINFTFSETP